MRTVMGGALVAGHGGPMEGPRCGRRSSLRHVAPAPLAIVLSPVGAITLSRSPLAAVPIPHQLLTARASPEPTRPSI